MKRPVRVSVSSTWHLACIVRRPALVSGVPRAKDLPEIITRSFLDSGTPVWYGQHGGHQGDDGREVRDDLPASELTGLTSSLHLTSH